MNGVVVLRGLEWAVSFALVFAVAFVVLSVLVHLVWRAVAYFAVWMEIAGEDDGRAVAADSWGVEPGDMFWRKGEWRPRPGALRRLAEKELTKNHMGSDPVADAAATLQGKGRR